MAKVFKDIAVKTGEYEHNGETKGRYKNCGKLMENDDGGLFILMDRTFNPAGVPSGDRESDQILISTFDPKPKASKPY